jgi:hypothetical protein
MVGHAIGGILVDRYVNNEYKSVYCTNLKEQCIIPVY